MIVYRPQNSDDHHRVLINTFLTEFSDLMESTILSKEPLIVVGDYNIHVDVPNDTDALKLLDLLESLGLEQHVTEPTHIHGHTLDLVMTRKIEDILASPPRACRYFSDHAAVRCDVAVSKPSFQTRIIKFRKTKSLDAKSLSNDVVLTGLCDRGNSDPITPRDLDVLVKDYTTTLSQVLDHHAPLRTKKVRARPKIPWYTLWLAFSRALFSRRDVRASFELAGLTSEHQRSELVVNLEIFLKLLFMQFLLEIEEGEGLFQSPPPPPPTGPPHLPRNVYGPITDLLKQSEKE